MIRINFHFNFGIIKFKYLDNLRAKLLFNLSFICFILISFENNELLVDPIAGELINRTGLFRIFCVLRSYISKVTVA